MRGLWGHCGHWRPPVIGMNDEGKYKTAASAAYPGEMCKLIAEYCVSALQSGETVGDTGRAVRNSLTAVAWNSRDNFMSG